MDFADLFTPHHIALLVDWFEEKQDLCVEIYIPHGGGSGSFFTVRSLRELKELVKGLESCEVQITIWKNHSQSELESDEANLRLTEPKWIYTHAQEVMYFSVQKNRNRTESYVNDPAKYAGAIREWLD